MNSAFALGLLLTLGLLTAPASAANLAQVSSDPYTNATSQHRTEVEPDTFSKWATVVGVFQVGRFYDGGSSNIGFVRSGDAGATWSNGFLPGITVYQGGTYPRVSDPAVAYDVRHNTWLAVSLTLRDSPSVAGAAVVVNRSNGGGANWTKPVTVATGGDLDKTWVTCDNSSTSPYYGRCYAQWDDHGDSNRMKMSTSADGGLTWSVAKSTADNATGLGGQPLVRPNGTVVVPYGNAYLTGIRAFRSVDGGATWSSTVPVASVAEHTVAGGLRTSPLPSAEIDAAGRVYVVWQDCRFRASCSSNDIVMSTSLDGLSWSAVLRIPIDSATSGVDHFIPGLAIDPGTAGSTAHLALTYHYYPSANCSSSTCALDVGYVSSTNGGSTWTLPTQLAGAMRPSYLPNTSQGRMAGDYMSTSFVQGKAIPIIPSAGPPSGTVFNQAMYAPLGGLSATSGTRAASSSGVVSSGAAGAGQARRHARRIQ